MRAAGIAASPPIAGQGALAALDQALGRLVEIPAALLVVAEIVILFAGVVARYALHTPWSGRTNWPRCFSFGWRCWARSWRCGGASTCAWPRW